MSRGSGERPALYEPIHGSAPTLAGKDVASPARRHLFRHLDAARIFRPEHRSPVDRIGNRSRAGPRLSHRWTSPNRAAGSCAARNSRSKFAGKFTTRSSTPSATAGEFSVLLQSGLSSTGGRNHVVQRLLFFCESRHDVADAERNQAGNNFCEEAPRGVAEADPPSLQIGHD